MTLPQYVEYLERYSDRFGLTAPIPASSRRRWEGTPFADAKSRLQFGWKVVKVERGPNGAGHVVEARAPDGAFSVEDEVLEAALMP